jgi:hypothetical protein
MDSIRAAVPYAPERSRAVMRKRRTVAAGKDCGHEKTLTREAQLPDAIDPGPDPCEAPASDSVPNRFQAEPKAEQLCTRDDAMLPANEPPNGLMVN